jgi:hypothetical protein
MYKINVYAGCLIKFIFLHVQYSLLLAAYTHVQYILLLAA